jgi:hypothetical protein
MSTMTAEEETVRSEVLGDEPFPDTDADADSGEPIRSYGKGTPKLPKWLRSPPQHSFMLTKMVAKMRSLRGKLKGPARIVLLHLAIAASFQPGVPHTSKMLRWTIADDTGLSEAEVTKAIAYLKATGYITVESCDGGANIYTLIVKAIYEAACRDHESSQSRLRDYLVKSAASRKARRAKRKAKLEDETPEDMIVRMETQTAKMAGQLAAAKQAAEHQAADAAELDAMLDDPVPASAEPTSATTHETEVHPIPEAEPDKGDDLPAGMIVDWGTTQEVMA